MAAKAWYHLRGSALGLDMIELDPVSGGKSRRCIAEASDAPSPIRLGYLGNRAKPRRHRDWEVGWIVAANLLWINAILCLGTLAYRASIPNYKGVGASEVIHYVLIALGNICVASALFVNAARARWTAGCIAALGMGPVLVIAFLSDSLSIFDGGGVLMAAGLAVLGSFGVLLDRRGKQSRVILAVVVIGLACVAMQWGMYDLR